MSRAGRTKDEFFVITLYEEALHRGDLLAEINRYDIGRRCGLQTTAVDTICTLLAKANFIKKQGLSLISLTPNGVVLAEGFLS